MKQSVETDIVCIERILKYVDLISDAYSMFNIGSETDLKNSHVCQLAVAQAITNINELRKKLRDETVKKMPLFGSVRLKAARNIASHDYDSLDFDIIYKRTQQILNPEVNSELEAMKNAFESSNTNDVKR